MATRFVQQATQQLDPVYQQQTQAIQSQIPAVQQLYDTLFQGLEGQRQAETQNILESAGARGVLRSSLPVDLQTALGQSLLQERGRLGAQQASDIAGINERIGNLGVNRAGAIADLARALEIQDIDRKRLGLETKKANRDYQIQQQQLAIEKSKAAASGSSNKSSAPTSAQNMAAALSAKTGDDGYVSPGTWSALKNQWVSGGYGSAKSFDKAFAGYRNPGNPYYKLG